ncbi:uncharacterized protein KABA2_03S12474 [Maudiozyma barnettii]|uniref:BZIP domain-containing protein n=1 Tax=Maudiozyma barnettii TaxID=61262 RepID=A0A8H2VEJ7_9SACH|nr:hypothetical protein, no similarity [Kazachstania barnettii]CAB4254097.1 hypothetical protein, no similarity [Kazachstania barnettii]
MTTSNIRSMVSPLPSISVKEQMTDNSENKQLSTTSSIHVSKNWVLPERLKPGRKPVLRSGVTKPSATSSSSNRKSLASRLQLARSLLGTSRSLPSTGQSREETLVAPSPSDNKHDDDLSITDDITIEDGSSSSSGRGNDSAARRRKQNRDAQRAYRERKANRIHILEDTVSNLQTDVELWQTRCDNLVKEREEAKFALENALDENESLLRQIQLLKDEVIVRSASNESDKNSISFDKIENDSLNEMIQNFTPMKAIPLIKKNSNCKGNNSGDCCSKKKKMMKKDDLPDLKVWTPGSCDRCKADPNNKAFCKSIFKDNMNPSSTLPESIVNNSSGGDNSNIKQLPLSPSSIMSQETNKPCNDNPKKCCGNCPKEKKTKEYIPITDTYQRIRKHMTSQQDNTCISKLKNESNKNSTLINVLQNIATDLEVNGREIEVTSIEKALDNLEK